MTIEGKVPSHKRLLKLENIRKAYRANMILRDVNLEIFGNEHVYITGSKGSGKTTLLEIAAGLFQPDSGDVVRGAR